MAHRRQIVHVDGGEGGGSLGMGQLFGGRWQWLGRPAFLACVVMLALNDHVLKQRFPLRRAARRIRQ